MKKGVAQFQTNELPLLFLKSPKFCGQMNACCSESQLKGHLLRVHHWARAEENQCGSEGPLSTNWLEIQHFCFQISRQGISNSIYRCNCMSICLCVYLSLHIYIYGPGLRPGTSPRMLDTWRLYRKPRGYASMLIKRKHSKT